MAELIIAEEFKWGRWQEADLKTRPKGDPVKVALAARLRAETTMTVGVDRRTSGDIARYRGSGLRGCVFLS